MNNELTEKYIEHEVQLRVHDEKFTMIESQLNKLNNKIDRNFDVLDKKIDKSFEILDKKIDKTVELLDNKIDKGNEKLDHKINFNTGIIVTTIIVPVILHKFGIV